MGVEMAPCQSGLIILRRTHPWQTPILTRPESGAQRRGHVAYLHASLTSEASLPIVLTSTKPLFNTAHHPTARFPTCRHKSNQTEALLACPPWLPHAVSSGSSPPSLSSLAPPPSWLRFGSAGVYLRSCNTSNPLPCAVPSTHSPFAPSQTPPWPRPSTRHRLSCLPSSLLPSRAWSMTLSDWYVALFLDHILLQLLL